MRHACALRAGVDALVETARESMPSGSDPDYHHLLSSRSLKPGDTGTPATVTTGCGTATPGRAWLDRRVPDANAGVRKGVTTTRTQRWIIALGVALLLISGAAYLLRSKQTAIHYVTAPVERGTIVTEIVAAGTVSALVRTEVSSQLSGQVTEVLVDFNDKVSKGRILARLDPRSFEARVREGAAKLDMARAEVSTRTGMAEETAADLANAEALRAVAEAEAMSSLARFNEVKKELERRRGLASRALISDSELAEAEAEHDSSYALLQAARARVQVHEAAIHAATARARIAESQLEHARAEVRQHEAVLEQNEVDLKRTEIRSPIDGIVIRRNVDVGQTVAASLQAPTLFTIARDLDEMTVECQVDEADIGRIDLGQQVAFAVEAYPGRRFTGSVVQIRKAPITFQNVVTYKVIVAVANPDQALLPGMTAIARILVDEWQDVLKVPNAALRYVPSGRQAPVVDAGFDSGASRGLPATVWILGNDGKPHPVAIETGATDDRHTALVAGPLTEGAEVITAESGIFQ